MDVGDWLRSLGLGQYEAAFRENAIDGEVLPKLTAEDLKDLGVAIVGHRRMMLSAIEALSAPSDAPSPAANAARAASSQPPPTIRVDAERRPITVMFCDLVGSTSLAARLDAEDWRNLVGAYLDEASAAVTALGGHVLKKLGDGLMALFGYPHAQENDAERAVRAALAIQRALADLNARNAKTGAPELAARIGLDTGPVVVDAAGEVFGEAPNVAARVQAAAEPGAVLVTAAIQRQTAGLFVAEDKGEHRLRGVLAPMTLYRIVRASGAGRRSGARTMTPLVGREDEIAMLMRRWERARQGEGQFVQIVGEPGIGKSRLIEEFHAKLGETPHTWVEWASSQLLQNTPLHPLAEWGRQRFGGDEVPAERRLADLESTLTQVKLDPGETAPLLAPLFDIPLAPRRSATLAPEELRRRQLAAMVAMLLAGARTQPVVLAFEDLHWADPTSLDLMQTLAERGAQAPLFIIATTRPEFRPPWAMRSHHNVMSLAPLDRAQVRRMVGGIASRHALSDEVIDGVGERTGGVPLFVEEVTRLLLERGERGGAQAIPPTLQQSLAARLDRLGPAREVAQFGAVLGRDFTFALLEAVSSLDEAGLRSSLERLAEADLLIVEGAGPQANYRFKHALIQDAAYDSLLKSRRQALHRRAAEILRDLEAEPEAIAHHFTQAGLDDLAIEWWGKAGDQALRRSAFQEAIAHLGKAIEMADKAGGGQAAGVSGQQLHMRVAYGNALIAARGHGAPETTAAFAHAHDSAVSDKDAPERFGVIYGLWVGCYARGDLMGMREHSVAFLREVEARPQAPEAGVAHRLAGVTQWVEGDFDAARSHLELALATFNPDRDRDLAFHFGQDLGVAAMSYLALALWPLGEVDRALGLIDRVNSRTTEIAHIGTIAYGYVHSILFEMMQGEFARTAPLAAALAHLAREHDLRFWQAYGEFSQGWASWRAGERAAGLAKMRGGVAQLREQNAVTFDTLLKGVLAYAEAQDGDFDAATATLDAAFATSERTGQRWFDAELHRTRGEILLKRDAARPALAEEAFLAALDIARAQKARSFGLRAAHSLAKLYQSTGRPVEAHDALGPALEGFAPTPHMPEIAEAQELLAALKQTEEVKADAAKQRRLTHLHVAYGNALLQARGYGASETTEVFARARESAADREAPERLAADYGLWVGGLVRGELSSMRAHAKAFLSKVEARPDSPEAGVAHRLLGTTHWFAGEYAEARDHLERALAVFQPGRDDDLAFRFGQDAGVAATLYLALALWPLGDVERAISLTGDAQERTARLAHIGTRAYEKAHAALFELMRGDLSRSGLNALELARLSREHDLPMWRAYAVFLAGAGAESDARGGGLEEMRRGAELLRQQGILNYDGLLKIALAEAETRAGDVDRALAILDEALATCGRTGHRAFEADLNRVRGDMLLKRDPANPAAAEEAIRTAIAVAQQQGARSFGLRAALSLAKLYQSTGRPVEAHDALAPAMEGFPIPSPLVGEGEGGGSGHTFPVGRPEGPDRRGQRDAPPRPARAIGRPEGRPSLDGLLGAGERAAGAMPEIAKARALIAALAETDEVKAEAARRHQRRQLQVAFGNALIAARGPSAPETTEAFARARERGSAERDATDRVAADFGLWLGSYFRGDLPSMRAHAETLFRHIEARPDSAEAGVAHRVQGINYYFAGDYVEAQRHLDRALTLFQPGRDDDLTYRLGVDAGVAAMALLAFATWPLGEVDRAISLIDRMTARAATLAHTNARGFGAAFACVFGLLRGDVSRAASNAVELSRLVDEHDLPMWRAFGLFFERLATAQSGALEDMRRGVELLREQNVLVFDGLFKIALAEAEAQAGDADRSLAILDEALATAEGAGYRAFEAELHRVRGEMLLKRDPSNPAPAEEALQTAIAVAKRQSTRSFELRAALSLAKLYQSTGRPVDAHAVLAPALEGFSPTPEMPEIAEAQALLAALAETDEVKAEAARRERRLKLQTGMATALLQGRGMQTPETRAAFEQAGDISAETADPMERLVILHGLWSGELGRGEARRMLEIAASMAPVAECEPSGQGALVARRVLGVSQFFAGDLIGAKQNMQWAADHYDFDRDHGHAIRFAHDQGVGALYYLAFAKWMLGDAETAFRLIGEAKRLAERLGHPPTSVAAYAIAAWLDIVRGDHVRARANAETALVLARDFDLPLWRSLAESVVAWTTAASEGTRAAWDEAEASWATSLAQGVGLAEPTAAYIGAGYAALGDFDRALALVDRALRAPAEKGLRVFLSEGRRVRGEILFRRDPRETAPAEQSLQAAIAIAREQGSCSFGLRAALSLAKLYQSTGRPIDAHAVLAPALEGFAPAAEMPEIAEAQALLAALGGHTLVHG